MPESPAAAAGTRPHTDAVRRIRDAPKLPAVENISSATTFDDLDDQRDRWLYSEALRGIPPAQAAQTWQHRLTLTVLRAAPRPQPVAA